MEKKKMAIKINLNEAIRVKLTDLIYSISAVEFHGFVW